MAKDSIPTLLPQAIQQPLDTLLSSKVEVASNSRNNITQDTLPQQIDTMGTQEDPLNMMDSIGTPKKKNTLDARVEYTSQDSMVMLLKLKWISIT